MSSTPLPSTLAAPKFRMSPDAMDASPPPPDIEKHKRPKRKSLFGSAYAAIVQYPHQASNGRRELRAIEKDAHERQDSRGGHSRSRSKSLGRMKKTNSVDTTIRIPTEPVNASASSSSDAVNEPIVEDFEYSVTRTPPASGSYAPAHDNFSKPRSKSASRATSPNFDDMDDGNGMPASIPKGDPTPAGPQEPVKRSMQIPTRTRYGGVPEDADWQSGRPRSQPRSSATTTSNIPSAMLMPQKERNVKGMHRASPAQPVASSPTTPDANGWPPGNRSSSDSIFSQETSATSIHTLPALQTKGPDNGDAQTLEPLMEDDPLNFDLVAPPQQNGNVGMYVMERRAETMFSARHLRTIFQDSKLLLKFTGFLNTHRPQSIPILIYYLDALKAMRAIQYANAIAEALEPLHGYGFTEQPATPTKNKMLESKAAQAFQVLVQEDLPAFIAHTWIQVVSVSIQRRITGTLAPHLREASEGLAEVFCLTDPGRPDNPIVFASEEFARTTQYGMSYTIGRNCRFLQGPKTSPHSVRRLADACREGKELTEVFVNYRRDGSPFMNLLMIAPLMDSRGNIRYFIGAQVDVSGLIKDCAELDGLALLVEKDADRGFEEEEEAREKDEFQDLSEMFNGAELETVRKHGGRMHKEYADESDRDSIHSVSRPRLILNDPSQDVMDRQRESMNSSVPSTIKERFNGKLEGVYQNYLLIRPAPSLRILFTSPSLRVPGILQSPFLARVGGSSRVRQDLNAALSEGRGVTAKIRWLTRADEDGEGEGRPRWIHCTPLLGHSGAVGVWMVVLVDEEGGREMVGTGRRFRQAPPVASKIGERDWDAKSYAPKRKELNAYDVEAQRRPGPSSAAGPAHGVVPSAVAGASSSTARPGTALSSDSRQNITPGGASEFSFNLK